MLRTLPVVKRNPFTRPVASRVNTSTASDGQPPLTRRRPSGSAEWAVVLCLPGQKRPPFDQLIARALALARGPRGLRRVLDGALPRDGARRVQRISRIGPVRITEAVTPEPVYQSCR